MLHPVLWGQLGWIEKKNGALGLSDDQNAIINMWEEICNVSVCLFFKGEASAAVAVIIASTVVFPFWQALLALQNMTGRLTKARDWSRPGSSESKNVHVMRHVKPCRILLGMFYSGEQRGEREGGRARESEGRERNQTEKLIFKVSLNQTVLSQQRDHTEKTWTFTQVRINHKFKQGPRAITFDINEPWTFWNKWKTLLKCSIKMHLLVQLLHPCML